MRLLLIATLFLTTFSIGFSSQSSAQFRFLTPLETDAADNVLVYYFDLRDRETYIQLTNIGTATSVHVQVFNASQDCNENNFFDDFTANDTHIYNLRDLQSNNGNPTGAVLPEGAYGVVFILTTGPLGTVDTTNQLVGNLRILDNSGYEYRTNAQGRASISNITNALSGTSGTFGFNIDQGTNFADIVGISYSVTIGASEVALFDIPAVFTTNILDENENIFSCSDTAFSCASFNYGINNSIPNSRDGALTCSGNTIDNGVVLFDIQEPVPNEFALFTGLNNGNGRGSMDAFLTQNLVENAP